MNRLPNLIEAYKDAYERDHGVRPTDADIAREARIDVATFSRYKNGHVNSVNLDVWQRLANLFKVPGSEIFTVVPEDEIA